MASSFDEVPVSGDELRASPRLSRSACARCGPIAKATTATARNWTTVPSLLALADG
jgi:hypothetical protein